MMAHVEYQAFLPLPSIRRPGDEARAAGALTTERQLPKASIYILINSLDPHTPYYGAGYADCHTFSSMSAKCSDPISWWEHRIILLNACFFDIMNEKSVASVWFDSPPGSFSMHAYNLIIMVY